MRPLIVLTQLALLAEWILSQSIVPFDEGCVSDDVAKVYYRCPRESPNGAQGICVNDRALCPIARLCNDPDKSFQCPEGTCASKFEYCESKVLECKYNE